LENEPAGILFGARSRQTPDLLGFPVQQIDAKEARESIAKRQTFFALAVSASEISQAETQNATAQEGK
jgi:hypothetical protein